MAFDAYGFLWISTRTGLQRFDGKNFYSIRQSNDAKGIHYNKQVYFMPLQNGELLMTTPRGMAFYQPATHTFRNLLISSVTHANDNYNLLTPLKEEGTAVWLREEKKILLVDKTSGTIKKEIAIADVNFPETGIADATFSERKQILDEFIYLMNSSSSIVIFNTVSGKIEPGFTSHEQYATIHNFQVLDKNTLLVLMYNGIKKIDIPTQQVISFCPYPNGKIITDNVSPTVSMQIIKDQYLAGINNDLFIYDVKKNIFTQQLVDIEQRPFLPVNLYRKLLLDKYNNIWAATYIQGIKKINYHLPAIKYYGTPKREDNFVKCIFVNKKKNLVLCGMLGRGLQVYDTNQVLIKNIPQFDAYDKEPTVAAIARMSDDQYCIIPYNRDYIYVFNSATLSLKKVNKLDPPLHFDNSSYYLNCFPETDSSYLLTTRSVTYRLKFIAGKIQPDSLFTDKKPADLHTFIHSNGTIWLGHTGSYSVFNPVDRRISSTSINDYVMVRCMAEDKTHQVWIATEKGLYKCKSDGSIITQYTMKNGLPDDGIYAVVTDNEGDIWFSHNKGISRINPDGTFFTMSKEDGLQENEFNTNAVFKTTDGELFFGGVNGLSSFYPEKIKINNTLTKLFVTDIKVKEKDWYPDTAFWNMHAVELPYNQNALAISFNAFGHENPEQYNYQYKMTSVDGQWINAGNSRTARYVLNPGEYRLLIYAGAVFNENATPQQEIKIVIRPAWWQTWLFKTGIAILGIGLFGFGIFTYNRRKFRKKLQEIKFEQQLQKERERISRDLHDNIGAYTSALIANADKLQSAGEGQNAGADRVKENAKQILSSLRETIWVLNSKEISITGFADGFKQYANKMLDSYPDISIQFEEKIENDKILSPAVALNLYRIIQEALQNTLKYAKAKRIDFSVSCQTKLIIILEDDGKGFNPDEKGFGNGLNNMEYRAAEAGYNFIINSKHGEGTKITLDEK